MYKQLHNTLLSIAVAVMILHVLIYIGFGVAVIPFPFDYDQAEGFELNNAILLAQGDCPYCDNDVFPFYASGYAPFFHILMVPFVWLFGPAFWYGRAIIFVSTFVTAATIGIAIFHEEKHKWVALLAGCTFLASNYIYHIGPLLRQHLLMVVFETIAVVLVHTAFSHEGKSKHQRLLIAFTMLLLAGYTKQLAYTTCLAVGIWMFLRSPRLALLYSAGLAIIAAMLFGVAMVATDGHWWINIIESNRNEYITEQFTGLLLQFLRLHWPLVLLATFMVIYEVYFSQLSAYSVWFVVSLLSTIGAGKWGAGDSYFATTLVGACILSGIFVARSIQNNWHFRSTYLSSLTKIPIRSSHAALAGLVLFIVYGATVIKLPTSGPIFRPVANFLNVSPKPGHRYPLYDSATWTVGYAVTGHLPSEEDVDNGWRIVEWVKAADGLVISEDAGFSIQAGRKVITNPVQLRNLWENDRLGDKGLYDPSNLLDMIENQEFALIIRRADLFPLPILVAIDTYYEQNESIEMNGFAYHLWVPKS